MTMSPPLRPPESGPLRLPDWRFQLLTRATKDGRALLGRRIGRSTRTFGQYLRKESECTNRSALQQLRRKRPTIAAALDLIREPSRETAALAESLILACESTTQIAVRCGIEEGTVAWYRFMFFSVGSQLNNVHYIVEYAIKAELRRGGIQARRHYAMKLLSYCCGSKVLDEYFFSRNVSLRLQWEAPDAFLKRLITSIDLQSLPLVGLSDIAAPLKPTTDFRRERTYSNLRGQTSAQRVPDNAKNDLTLENRRKNSPKTQPRADR